MESVIQVKGLTKKFGKADNELVVLNDLSLDIKQKEFVSIMGKSGCGKSTLLYILGLLDKPDAGEITILGNDIARLKEGKLAKIRRKQIGFVFQFYNLVQNLSVEENIMLPVIMDGQKEKKYKDELNNLLEIVGLEDKRKKLPHQLSGGQQQRVAIARSIILSPDILLADEPIGNLDSKSGTEVMELFRRINQEENITIVQVTHSQDAAMYGNRVLLLEDGKIQ